MRREYVAFVQQAPKNSGFGESGSNLALDDRPARGMFNSRNGTSHLRVGSERKANRRGKSFKGAQKTEPDQRGL
jgi:hypothetical protein